MSLASSNLDGLRVELQLSLEKAERWLRDLSSDAYANIALPSGLSEDITRIAALRTRAASVLINAAMLGGFSSGKSFLVSALQGGLELTQVSTDDGVMLDKFIGLLPSATKQVNACPVTVVPVADSTDLDTAGRGYVRVRLEDTGAWEEVGNSPAPTVVAAYVTTDPDLDSSRLREHWNRKVAEVEILITDFRLPAKLYDLPGHGGVDAIHDQVLRDAMANAECYIYVCSAAAVLGESDLDLIRFLYNHHIEPARRARHHLDPSKRVVWVVTAIDRARELGWDNQPAWKATVDTNNAYLREHFTLPDGSPDWGFIGEGFIPVSPALEARGRFLIARGEETAGHRLLAESRMDELRRVLGKMISEETGPRHIARVANDLRSLLLPYQRTLSERLKTERVPVDQLRLQHTELGSRLRNISIAVDATGSRLGAMLDPRIRNALQPFERLASHLHSELDERILSADIGKPKVANQIEVHRAQVVREWITAPTGPLTNWERELSAFRNDVWIALRTAIMASHPVDGLQVNAMIDIEQLTTPRSQSARANGQDMMQTAAALVGGVLPIATTVMATLGIVTGPLLLIPGALTAGAVVTYAAIERRKRENSLDVMRREWIAGLDETANEARRLFLTAATSAGVELIGRALDILAERRDQLAQSIQVIENRLADPVQANRRELITRLEPLCQDGQELVLQLSHLLELAQN
jgi:hypothetical protein